MFASHEKKLLYKKNSDDIIVAMSPIQVLTRPDPA